jgi:hypothetical protein
VTIANVGSVEDHARELLQVIKARSQGGNS